MNVSTYFRNLVSSTYHGAHTAFREAQQHFGRESFEDYCAEQLNLGVGYYGNVPKYQENQPKIAAEAARHPVRAALYSARGSAIGSVAGLVGGISGFCVGLVGRHALDGTGW